MSSDLVHLPPLRQMALRAFPRLVEGVLVPTALFLLLLNVSGVGAAILGGLAWSTSVILIRRIMGRRVPALVLVGLGVLLLRSVLALATGSSFLYFLQPTLGTATAGLVLLGSALLGRPLILRLARDFCPLPADTMGDPHLRRFFLGISFFWGVTQLLNAAVTLWLLVNASVGMYVVTRTAMSWTLTIVGIAISLVWFMRVLRRRQEHALIPIEVRI
jgi:intracellular septation protein A